MNLKLRLATIAFLLLAWVGPAFGQCAMCYSSAAGSPKEAQRALARAVLVLLTPPVGIMIAGGGFAFRYGKKRDREEDGKTTSD